MITFILNYERVKIHIGGSLAVTESMEVVLQSHLLILFGSEWHFDPWREAGMFISMGITYLILTIVTGVLGFWLLAEDAAWIARDAFFIFLAAFGLSFLMTGQRPDRKKN